MDRRRKSKPGKEKTPRPKRGPKGSSSVMADVAPGKLEKQSQHIEAALSYAARKWHVFPVRGKRPCITGWQKYATANPETNEDLWRKFPDANIGIATGPSRLVVLDVDNKHDGDAALTELCARHSWHLETYTVRTGSGGRHYYFETPQGIIIPSGVNVLGAGLDIRAHNGFVVAPPSLHASGIRYQVAIPRPVAALPESILARLAPGAKCLPRRADNAPI